MILITITDHDNNKFVAVINDHAINSCFLHMHLHFADFKQEIPLNIANDWACETCIN